MNLENVSEFLQGIKDGEYRGDYYQEEITESIRFEVSVGSFEYGHIHIRLLIEDKELTELPEDAYVQQSFRLNSEYQDVYDELVELLQQENESVVTNAHSWERSAVATDHPSLPDTFDKKKTVFFEDFVRIHPDLSIEESIETNRT